MVDGPISPSVANNGDSGEAIDRKSLQDALDRLSHKVDAGNFERMRWGRDEMPKLLRLVELVKGAVEDRSDIEINEEGGEGNSKRFVIKVHGQRIAGLGMALDKGRAVAAIGSIERSSFAVEQGDPIHTLYENVDAEWMAQTLGTLMERIVQR
uniref:hypothetical protein n=1 Tax=Parerythrobacter lutipelagi TaxID=1964208 RepID=UPI0010F9A512|nr:hypothetical protein [Parerythrobacter lutipelagi]